MIATGKVVYYFDSLLLRVHKIWGRAKPCHIGPPGEGPGLVGKQGEPAESMGSSLYCGFHEKEWVR